MNIYIAGIFVITKIWKQPKCFSTREWKTNCNLYNVILLNKKTERTNDTCNNMGEPQMYYPKWKKPDSTSYTLYYSIYITWERQNYRDQKYISDYKGPGCGQGLTTKGKYSWPLTTQIDNLTTQIWTTWVHLYADFFSIVNTIVLCDPLLNPSVLDSGCGGTGDTEGHIWIFDCKEGQCP